MKPLLREMEWLRRYAARNVERWSFGPLNELHTEDGVYIGNSPHAEYVARLHNSILPLTNLVISLRAKLADRAQIAAEEEYYG